MKIFKLLAFSLFILIVACGPKKEIETFPQEALDAKLFDVAENELTVSKAFDNLKGHKTVIKLWAGWCGDCIKSMPEWNEFKESHPNVNTALFSVDHNENTWKNAIAKYNVQGIHYRLDEGKDWKKNPFTSAIGLDWIPRYVVLDENGNIISIEHIVDITDAQVEELLK